MRRWSILLLLALLVAAAPRGASAQCTQSGACLEPRTGCGYFGSGPTIYGATGYGVRNINLSSFTQCFAPPGGGNSADSFFDVFVELELTTNGGGTWTPGQHTAHAGEHALEHADLIHYDTEMLQLDLSGLPGGVMIRESPTLASNGSTALTDLGGGQFKIDSFFDVFTELSFDGGVTWTPSGTVMHIATTPETETPVRASSWGALKLLYR